MNTDEATLGKQDILLLFLWLDVASKYPLGVHGDLDI